jgi:hypothetical protein
MSLLPERQTQICTHTFSIHSTTQVRPQGCQAREHAWRQLLKLVAAKVQKVQRAVAKQNVEIDQIEPEQIVSARDRDGSGGVFVRFCSCCGIILRDTTSCTYIIPLNSCFVWLVRISSHNTYVTDGRLEKNQHPDIQDAEAI